MRLSAIQGRDAVDTLTASVEAGGIANAKQDGQVRIVTLTFAQKSTADHMDTAARGTSEEIFCQRSRSAYATRTGWETSAIRTRVKMLTRSSAEVEFALILTRKSGRASALMVGRGRIARRLALGFVRGSSRTAAINMEGLTFIAMVVGVVCTRRREAREVTGA